jgi:hypothetical protein
MAKEGKDNIHWTPPVEGWGLDDNRNEWPGPDGGWEFDEKIMLSPSKIIKSAQVKLEKEKKISTRD